MNCCGPLMVDDEHIDMQLEEVWEIQRKRSKSRNRFGGKPGRMNILRGNKNRRGFSLTRNRNSEFKGRSRNPLQMMRGRRSMSVGRQVTNSDSEAEEEQVPVRRSRSPWGRRKRQVSINKYVERIDTKPMSARQSRGRSRSAERIARPRSRSWSLSRRKNKSETHVGMGMVRVRSRSQERQAQRLRKEKEKQERLYRKQLHQRQQERRRSMQYEESSDDDSRAYSPPRRQGIMGIFSSRPRRREARNDDWSSSDDDSFDEY